MDNNSNSSSDIDFSSLKKLKIGYYQGVSSIGDVNKNLKVMKEVIIEASTEKCLDVIVFPELFLSSYQCEQHIFKEKSISITKEDPIFNNLCDLANEYKIYIVGTAPEINNNKDELENVYNTAFCIDKNGELICHHRKTHLWSKREKEIFNEGTNFTEPFDIIIKDDDQDFEIKYKVALLICYEIEFPEIARVLKVKYDIDLILVPTANGTSFINQSLVPTRAFENHIHIVYVNYPKSDSNSFCGESCVVGPDGKFVVRSDSNDNGIFISEIDKYGYSEIKEREPFLEDRIPGLYKELCEQK